MKKRRTFSISVAEEVIEAVDKLVEKRRFGSRSQAIEYCIKQVVEVEGKEGRYIDFLLEFLELMEDRPDISEKLKKFLKSERKGKREGKEQL